MSDEMGQDLDQQKKDGPSAEQKFQDAKTIVVEGTKAVESGGADVIADIKAADAIIREGAEPLKKTAKGLGIACIVELLLGALAVLFVIGLFNPTTAPGITPTDPGSATAKPNSKAEWVAVYKYAGELMKIEWEFLAAITKQETGMGNNFGKCSYFAPAPAGGHVLTKGNGLRSSADKEAFERVMNKLNKPLNTPVSCNPKTGNGGAMGYTQFMPREWEGGANNAMQRVLGHYPDPWNATDATVMAGQLLKAKVGISTTQAMPVNEALYRKAASKYYGDGNPTGKYANSVYSFYLKIKRDQHI